MSNSEQKDDNQKNDNQKDNQKDDNQKIEYEYENLIFEGGGIKGLAYCGSITLLEKMNILNKIKRYGGSSAGAITATLLAIGYNSSELHEIISNTNFGSFIDDKVGIIRDTYSFFTKYGVCSGDTFSNIMKTHIKNKTGNENYTFKNLYDEKKIELVITGTNLTNMETVYFYHGNYPDLPIYKAVRISMSIPYLFVPVTLNNKIFVDGGFIDNYPIHIFDGKYPGDPDAKMEICKQNSKTLGLKLLTPGEEETYKINESENNINSIKNFSMSLASTLMLANEQKYVNPSNWKRTICVKVPNYPLTKFKLSEQEKQLLINSGTDAVNCFFNKIN
jgi:NTE family protein